MCGRFFLTLGPADLATLFQARLETALEVSARTLDPLSADERRQLLALLARLT